MIMMARSLILIFSDIFVFYGYFGKKYDQYHDAPFLYLSPSIIKLSRAIHSSLLSRVSLIAFSYSKNYSSCSC